MVALVSLLLASTLLWLVMNVEKAYLHVCLPAQVTAGVTSSANFPALAKPVSVVAPNGVQYWLSIGPRPLVHCDNVKIGVDVKNVAAIYPVLPSLLHEHGNELYLSGPVKDGAMTIHAIKRKDTSVRGHGSAERYPAPLAENLLGDYTGRVFGIEGRVRITSKLAGPIAFNCDAGFKPAGVVLHVPWYLPQADLTLELAGSGRGNFGVGLIDRHLETQEDARAIGAFDAATGSAGIFHIPHGGLARPEWRALSLSCPETGGALKLTAVRLLPVPTLLPAPKRATWVWKADDWKHRSAALLAHARRYDMDTLYIAVEVRAGAVVDQAALSAFIAAAASEGRIVWTVDGDPKMVLPTEHAATVRRVKAYVDYNRSMDATARLQGVQFDIEPYLLANYDATPDEWDRQYLVLTAALHDAAEGLPLEMVVPYWWGKKTAFLKALAPFVASLNVMDYRTKVDEIYRFAVPFLDWGARHGKKVRITLEAGPVAAETRWSCKKVDHGQYWLVPIKDMAVMLQLINPLPNPHGPAFSHQSDAVVASNATTFHGKQDEMMALLPQLEERFSAWGAFSGMAIHELER